MNPELLRYGCQLNLPEFGEATQDKLAKARVLVVGVGGLGCPAAQYLAAAGIGNLCIADRDSVSEGNLHRQILFNPEDIGRNKAAVAVEKLRRQNPQINIEAIEEAIDSTNIIQLLQQYELVVDCTDNFETKYLLNDGCVLTGKPLVFAAIYQYEGQLSVWNLPNEDGSRSPNYRDLFPQANATTIPDCASGGVLPSLAGMMGCMQANEVLKYFSGKGEMLKGKLLVVDALTLETRIISLGQRTVTNIRSLEILEPVQLMSVTTFQKELLLGTIHLIDVRSVTERTLSSIGGHHLPDGEIEGFHPAGQERYLVYCASGKRSVVAVRKLQQRFPDSIFYSLAGGLNASAEKD